MLQKEIEKKLTEYLDPYLKQDLFAAQSIKKLSTDGQQVLIEIGIGYPCKSLEDDIINKIKGLLSPLCGQRELTVLLNQKIDSHTGRSGMPPLPGVKNIIAVGSGKGGVGKSTIAVNLALALAKEAKTGLLDADIYGPSQPMMLGTEGEKPRTQGKILQPIEKYGLQSMSIGYLVGQKTPMIWRGPMLGKALQQLIQETEWDALDYLVIDLPPGTGDVALTLCQKIPLSGAVIVTTPQDLALQDVRRACEMFNKMNVPILGIIENMSHYHCRACGHEEAIFGAGGAKKLAEDYKLELLAAVPLEIEIRKLTDGGKPPASDANNPHAELFRELARKVGAAVALQMKSYFTKFPKIKVEHE